MRRRQGGRDREGGLRDSASTVSGMGCQQVGAAGAVSRG